MSSTRRSKFAILLAIAVACVTTAWAGWSSEEKITGNRKLNDLRFVSQNHIVVAANGVRHLVWYNSTGALYKRYYPSSGWTAEYKLGSSSSMRPAIALDPNGSDIHVVWQAGAGKYNHVFYQKCVPGSSGNGGWVGAPTDITPGLKYNVMWPAVACFQDLGGVNHVVATWFNIGQVGFRECVGGIWGNTVYFNAPVIPGHSPTLWDPSIAADPQARYGDVYIAYLMVDPDTQFVVRRREGIWQSPEPIPADGGYCSIEVDPVTGFPHVVSSEAIYPGENGRVRHTYWDVGLGGWQPRELISDPNISISACGNMSFAGGSAFVVWSESSSASDRGIRYKTGNYGNWSAPGWVTSGHTAGFPDVTASSSGNVYVVWGDGNCQSAPCEIWGRLYTPGSGPQAEPSAFSESSIELFPNPAKAGRVTVRYALPHAEPIAVTLLDVTGRAVKTPEIAASGVKGSFAIDASGLNRGVYILKFDSGSASRTRKLVIQ